MVGTESINDSLFAPMCMRSEGPALEWNEHECGGFPGSYVLCRRQQLNARLPWRHVGALKGKRMDD